MAVFTSTSFLCFTVNVYVYICTVYICNTHCSHLQAPGSNDIMIMDVGERESTLAEADMASVFHQIWREKHKDLELEMAPQQGKELRVSDPLK